jgi:hypothetical protein
MATSRENRKRAFRNVRYASALDPDTQLYKRLVLRACLRGVLDSKRAPRDIQIFNQVFPAATSWGQTNEAIANEATG